MKMKTDRFQELLDRWPSAWVARSEIRRFTGGAICGRTLANLEARQRYGEDIQVPKSFRVGRRSVYRAIDLVEWLANRYGDQP